MKNKTRIKRNVINTSHTSMLLNVVSECQIIDLTLDRFNGSNQVSRYQQNYNNLRFCVKKTETAIKMVTFAPDEIGLADKSPCAGIRADLKLCLLASDCCKKERKTPRECLKQGAIPEECIQLRQTFFECKRSLLDNRRRFRGHKGY